MIFVVRGYRERFHGRVNQQTTAVAPATFGGMGYREPASPLAFQLHEPQEHLGQSHSVGLGGVLGH